MKAIYTCDISKIKAIYMADDRKEMVQIHSTKKRELVGKDFSLYI